MNVDIKLNSKGILLATLKVRPIMVKRVIEAQTQDTPLYKVIKEVKSGS